MARPSNYLGANLTLQDTFSSVIERSNEIAYDLGTIVVTTAPVTQANNTNGALTTGNAHVQGFFSANTLIATDALRGGSLDTPAVLTVTSNTNFTGNRIYTSDTTIADFGANVTLSAASADNFARHLVVDFGNTHFTQGELRVSGNTIFDNSAAVIDIDTNLVDVTANVQVQSAFVTMNVDSITLGSDATDDLAVNSNTVFNSDVLVGTDATTLLEVNSETIFNNDVLIGENETDLLEVNANTVINNDMYIGSDATDTLTVNATSTFNNNVTLGSDSTDDLVVNADSDFNANVNIDGVLTTTNNVVLGSDGTDTLTVNADSDFNANVNVDGIFTATNNAVIGSDGTDSLTVNADTDFNANVNVDGIFTATNNAIVGSDGTDTLTVNAQAAFNANVTVGDAEADTLDVNATTTFNNGVTVGSSGADQLLVNSNTVFQNDVAIGSSSDDSLVVNADSIFISNVEIFGVVTASNNVTLGSDGTDQLIVNSNTGFTDDVVVGSDANNSLTVQSTTSFNNDVTVGSDGTDQLTVNSNTGFTDDVVIGSDANNSLTINSDSDFNANVNIDGVLTTTNNVVIGSDGTDSLTVNADSDFNANVNVDGVFTATNNAVIGSDGTDTLTVNSVSTLNANVTIGDAEADTLDVNATTTFNNGVTIGSDEADQFTINSNTDFVNSVTVGSDGTDSLTVNADSDFNANVNIDGELTVGNNVTLGASSDDTLTIQSNTSFNHDVTIGNSDVDKLTINADISSSIIPTANTLYNLGRTDARWDELFVDDVTVTANTTTRTAIIRNTEPVLVAKNSSTGYPQLTISLDANNGNSSNVVSFSTTAILPQTATIALGSTSAEFSSAYFAANTYIKQADTQFTSAQFTIDGDQLDITSNTGITNNLTVTGDTTLTELSVTGNSDVSGHASISQTLTVTGETTFSSNTTITGTHKPSANNTYDLGATGAYFNDIYVDNFVSPNYKITSLNDTPGATPSAGQVLIANTTGGFEYTTVAVTLTDLNDTPSTVTAGSVLVGNTTNGFDYSPYINKLVDLIDVLDNAPANSHVLAYIEDSGGFEFRSPQSLSEDFSLTLDDLTDVDATVVAAGHVIVANTSLQWESKELELGLLTDVNATSSQGDVLVANSTGGFEFTAPSTLSIELNDLSNVTTTGVADGEILAYVAATQTFEPTAPSALSIELDDLSNVTTTGAANSEVLTYIAATDSFEFTAYGWVLGNSQNATTGQTITNAENVNFYGGSNITVTVGTGPLGQTNVQIAQDDVVLGVNDLTDGVSYNSGISIGVGADALANDDGTVNYNTAFGYQALNSVTIGTSNLGVGANAGDNIVTGFNNTVIGRGAQASASDASNEVTLGNGFVTDFRIPGIGLTANTTSIEFDGGTVATQSFVSTSVSNAIADLANSAPAALDTLNELAAALGDDANFSTTVTNSLATKATLDDDVSFANVSVEALVANTISTTSAVVGQTITSTAGLLNLNGWEIDANLFDNSQTVIYADATHQFVGNVEIGNTLSVSNNASVVGDLTVSGTIDGNIQSATINVETLTANNITATQTINGQISDISNHNTDDVAEGEVNLYYTVARANTAIDDRLGAKTTTDLTEGDNLYYTVARANTAIDDRVTKSFVDALNVDADTLDGANGTFYLDYTNFTNTPTLYTTANANSDIDARVTKSFVDALNVDADTLDGINSTQFLRSDQSTTITSGSLTITEGVIDLGGYVIDASEHAVSNTVYYTSANHSFDGTVEATDFNSTSDARIKENVVTIGGALSKVCDMRGVYYNRIGEDETQVGVIAQEVEKVIPEAVQTNQNDLKTVSYGNLVGVLIEAIKDLKAEIDELKKNQ